MSFGAKVLLSLIDGFIVAYGLDLYVKHQRFFTLGFAVVITMLWAIAVFVNLAVVWVGFVLAGVVRSLWQV